MPTPPLFKIKVMPCAECDERVMVLNNHLEAWKNSGGVCPTCSDFIAYIQDLEAFEDYRADL